MDGVVVHIGACVQKLAMRGDYILASAAFASRAVRETLDIWPPLPITVWGTGDPHFLTKGSDNVIAALELSDPVCEIDLRCIPGRLWDRFLAAMRVSFPMLTSLHLGSMTRLESVVPDSFLGGSAPRLQTLWLDNVLSATDLVHLYPWDVPDCDPILVPVTMVTCFSVMSRLETLHLRFHSRGFFGSDQISPQSPSSTALLPTISKST
jgi:hypothetical protein